MRRDTDDHTGTAPHGKREKRDAKPPTALPKGEAAVRGLGATCHNQFLK